MTNQEGNIVAHYLQNFNGAHHYAPCQQEVEFHLNISLGGSDESYFDLLQFEEKYRDLNI